MSTASRTSQTDAHHPGIRFAQGGALVILRAAGLVLGLAAGLVVIGWLATVLLAPAATGVFNSIGFGVQVPPEVALAGLDQTSTVYAADGSVIAVLHDEVDRTVVTLDEVPAHVQNAVIAAEDRRFWEHDGYDAQGLGRALLENIQSRGVSQGGSTITQQLAKSEVGDDISIQRKLTEIAFAMALERELTKEQILERYLNQVYFGGGAYGIAAAAEEYFGKDVSQLSAAEAATLAGQIRSPGATDMRNFPEIAIRRRNATLVAMVEEGWLDRDQLAAEVETELRVLPRVFEQPTDPFIAEAVKQEFYTLAEFGADRLERNNALLRGGLNVHTSFDPGLQEIAREVVSEYYPTSSPTAALAAVDPRTGQIRAIYGGQDFRVEQYNFATQGRRQPGSAWKPFVMATALEIGFSPSMMLEGTSPARFPTGDTWETQGVQNYGGASHGPVSMRQALIRSTNTAFAQLMLVVGPENVISLMDSLGVNTRAATGGILNPSIALGGLEVGVTPLEMAGAYSVFANGGAYVRPGLIDRVTDQQGNVLYERDVTPQQILDFVVNEVMVDTMESVICCGTGGRASLRSIGWPAGGKTGTAQSNADAWFSGFTPVLSTSVWTGHPEARIRMPGATGGNIPAQIWRDFMTRALEGIEPLDWPTEPPGGQVVREAVEGEVTVPDVRGMQDLEALRALADVGLPSTTTEVASDRPAGTVVWQSPRGDSVVPAGTQIQLGVSTGRPPPPPTTVEEEPTEPEEPIEEEPPAEGPPPSGPTENPNPQAPLPQPRPPEERPEPPAPQPRPEEPEPAPAPEPEPEPAPPPPPPEPPPEEQVEPPDLEARGG